MAQTLGRSLHCERQYAVARSALSMVAPQVVLQDGDPKRWLFFGDPIEVIQATSLAGVRPTLQRVERAVMDRGLYAAGFIAFDAAPAFDPAMRAQHGSETPLIWFGLFDPPEVWRALPDAAQRYDLGPWQAGVDLSRYARDIAQIKDHIARGDTYQVNYTFPMVASFAGDPWEMFVHLARSQRARYMAFIDTGAQAICSGSPELFFRLERDVLTSRPMKGTARRGRTLAEDEVQRDWLRNSPKNRAENVMIVDMVRNDMGRIAEFGSVQVPALFEVERYPTLLQMTSTVTSRTTASLSEIMAALFPCASITGAPKISTMGIIGELESSPRGLYTGAIGYLAPGPQAQFNVAIRTAVVDRVQGMVTYGVGSGIVWDSEAGDEYAECLLKARVLTAEAPRFDLLETMLWDPQNGYALLERHLHRLAGSAEYFTITIDLPRVQSQLAALAATLPRQPHRVRLLVDEDGNSRLEAQVLETPANPPPVRLGLAQVPVDRSNVFLYHKTTHRDVYEAAQGSCPDCDDVLLWNEAGQITETTIANVAVRLDGALVTPPVASGLLPGTLRAQLLEEGQLQERVIGIDDLARCQGIYVMNSVRGLRIAVLV